jgi:hypothetical protein
LRKKCYVWSYEFDTSLLFLKFDVISAKIYAGKIDSPQFFLSELAAEHNPHFFQLFLQICNVICVSVHFANIKNIQFAEPSAQKR